LIKSKKRADRAQDRADLELLQIDEWGYPRPH
jgi:hypothetical protein